MSGARDCVGGSYINNLLLFIVCMCECVYECMSAYVHERMCACVSMHVCVCMYACTSIFV